MLFRSSEHLLVNRLQRVLHSACCTRVLLHIRLAFLKGRVQVDSDDTTFQPFTSIISHTNPSFNRDQYSSPNHTQLPGSARRPGTLSSGTVVYLPYGTVDSGSTGETIELKTMKKKKDDSTNVTTQQDTTTVLDIITTPQDTTVPTIITSPPDTTSFPSSRLA